MMRGATAAQPDGTDAGGLIAGEKDLPNAFAAGTADAEHSVATEDVQTRKEQKQHPLFAGRVKVYAKAVHGQVRRIKWAALIGLLAIYYITPWIRWDRGADAPNQAVLADMEGLRLYFFFIEIWPQEIFYLTGLLILAAFGLFLVSSLFGRIWCGYTCPQTVWTDLFMWVERKIEGDRNARMRFDKSPWSPAKSVRKLAKHGIWLTIALLTGGAWVMYFQDAPTVTVNFFTGQAGAGTYFFVGLFTATTYLLGGIAREQVCTYMCPWPRFQAALLDEDSLTVTYRDWRGEPRGKHKKGDPWDGRGDCVDCRQCVAVCPTGIDIRDGLQMECIGCGLCIDACDGVMEKVGRPSGLIAMDSERNRTRANDNQPPVLRFVRPRTIAYAVILCAVAGVMLFGLGSRSDFDLNVLHDRSPLYVTMADGSIRNGYQVRILNKVREPRDYAVTLEHTNGSPLEGATMALLGGSDADGTTTLTVSAAGDDVTTHQIFVTMPAGALPDEVTNVRFVVRDLVSGDESQQADVFRGPER